MSNVYFIDLKDKDLNSCIDFLEQCRNHFKNICIYSPILEKNTQQEIKNIKNIHFEYTFTLKEAIHIHTEQNNIFFNSIIEKYENLKKEYDFILILGLKSFSLIDVFNLNIKLAKNLNAAIVTLCKNEDFTIAQKTLENKLHGENFILSNEELNISDILNLKEYNFKTPHRFKYELIQQSKKNKKTVVLPESDDERILQACAILLQSQTVNLILLGNEKKVQENAKKLNLNLNNIQIIDPQSSDLKEELATLLYEERKNKGITLEEAFKLIEDKNYFGTLLIHSKKADAMVSGAIGTTAETIRPALQIIKTKEGISSVSGMFFIALEDQILAFADCAVNPNPTPEQLAQTAFVSAQTVISFGFKPKIAMLSYSSGNSGKGISVDLIKEALQIAQKQYPQLEIDGPMQFDSAYDLKTAKSKMPDSKIAGSVNVFIFPDLNAANICYKAVQRTANALAIGPILQGLKKPVNDLSRGCLVDDIVDTVILSAIQAQEIS